MSGIEEYIKMQEKINEQLRGIRVDSILNVDRSYLAYTSAIRQAATIQIEPSLISIVSELQRYKREYDVAYKSFTAVQEIIGPVLDSYSRINEAVKVVKMVQENIQPIKDYLREVKPVLPDSSVFTQIAEMSSRIWLDPSLVASLQAAVETHTGIPLWEHEEQKDVLKGPLAEEMQEDIFALTETEDKIGFLGRLFEKWGEKLIIAFIQWMLINFFGGLFQSWYEPIYKVLTPSFLLQEEGENTVGKIEIPVNTEIHVWNNITNNFIEVSYKIENTEYQGYMKQEEFETNTQKISDGFELEHLMFISKAVDLLADKWEISQDRAYEFLKEDTDLLNEYLLKHNDVLNVLEDAELVEMIEKFCVNEGIVIPNASESAECEPVDSQIK